MLSPWTRKWVNLNILKSQSNLYIFIFSLTEKGEFNDSIVDVNEKLDGMDSMNKTIENNLMNMETINQTVKNNSLGLKVLNSTMGKCRNCAEFSNISIIFLFIVDQNKLLIEGINGLNGTLESAVQDTKELHNVLNGTMKDIKFLGIHISKY